MANRGFTLVEVLVALTLAALAVTVAAGIFAASGDVIAALESRSRARDAEANAWRWLDDAFVSADVQAEPGARFQGDPHAVSFGTRLRVGDGWFEPQHVEIRYEPPRLVATLDRGATLVLADPLHGMAFDYLGRLGGDAPWLARWESTAVPPLAVRLRLQARGDQIDTLLFVLGERR